MINLIAFGEQKVLSLQSARVSYSFSEYSFKYATITISNDLRCVCQIVPQVDILHNCCFVSICVLQYSPSTDFTKVLNAASLNEYLKPSDIRVFENVVDAKYVDIILVLHKNHDVLQWKHNDNLNEHVRAILRYYVVIDSSLIILPQSKLFTKDVAYICVNTSNNKRLAFRISSLTEVRIKDVISVDKFKNMYSNKSERIIGLKSQTQYLESIYNANLAMKMSSRALSTKCIQKVLIIGPTGSGKSSLIQAFTESKKCGAIKIEGSDLLDSSPGASEEILCRLFNEAVQYCKAGDEDICIVHFEQLDSIWRNSNSTASHLKRLSCQLMQILENLNSFPGVIVIASTNDISSLDIMLRRSSQFQVELYVSLPDEIERGEILKRYDPFSLVNVCKMVALSTPGFSRADLRFLAREVRRLFNKSEKHLLNELAILQIWKQCVRNHRPSAMKKGLGVIQVGNTQLNHLGGLVNVKNSLKSYIDWPLKHPIAFKRLGIPIPKGILLYGPPGCAKTSLACAVSSATHINFLAVSAAELYSPYVGEAERNVIELFQKARVNSPCILFVDELDALVGNRNTSSKNVQSKVLSAFLTEMDGVGNKFDNLTSTKTKVAAIKEKSVIVIGATNRPSKIDSALLRPGRFDKLVYVGPPDTRDRCDILRTIINRYKIPLSNCVDLVDIAERTEFFSGADLTSLLKEAAYTALLKENMAAVEIKQEHIIESLNSVQPSLKNDIIELFSS